MSVSVEMRRWRSSERAVSRKWTISELSYARPGPTLTAPHPNRLDATKRRPAEEEETYIIMWFRATERFM